MAQQADKLRHHIATDKPYVQHTVNCQSCDTPIAQVKIASGLDCDLSWTTSVLCNGDDSHTLVPRVEGEDANCYVRSVGVD